MLSATILYSPSRSLVVLALLAMLAAPVDGLAQQSHAFWAEVNPAAVAAVGDRGVEPLAYRALALDFEAVSSYLRAAPMEGTPGRVDDGVLLELPMPDGSFATFRLVESPVMHPGLQERYPTIRTYLGVDRNAPGSTVRLSVSPQQGFHAMVFRPEGTAYIDPFSQFDLRHVRAYWRHDMPAPDPATLHADEVLVLDDLQDSLTERMEEAHERGLRFANGEILRVYRMAIAANRFYTAYHSSDSQNPTVAEGLAAIVTAINRINLIFEREIAVRLVLIENNDEIIYTSAETDPYVNSSGGTILNQNQANLNAVIGNANYDIGHVFITGGGGIAVLRSACVGAWKGMGASGRPVPLNNPFWVDIVSHEIGHQFGANHSFNGSAGSCAGNYNSGTSFEPGSGSTIMAYSGLCGTQNLQTLADDYFHNISLTEMITFLNGTGGTCAQTTPTANAIPEPILPPVFNIPILTPFMLPGGVDYDGDESTLTYIWEGMDSSAQGPPPGGAGWDDAAPYFRSFAATASPDRFFPTRLGAYVSQPGPGPPGFRGEGLPASTRQLRFRLTIRNNAVGGGSISDAQLTTLVFASRGPLLVTSFNEPGSELLGHQTVTVTWDVANTAHASVGAENVDILLSLNRHTDLLNGSALVLAESVPNNGAASVVIPAGLSTSQARFIVRANPGYFFAFNDADITIHPQISTEEDGTPAAAKLSSVYPNPLGVAGERGTINLEVDRSQNVRLVVFDALGREVAVIHDGPVESGSNHQFAIRARDLAAGTYFVRATGESFAVSRSMTVVH